MNRIFDIESIFYLNVKEDAATWKSSKKNAAKSLEKQKVKKRKPDDSNSDLAHINKKLIFML